jgi:hypothetical protein
MSQEARPIKSEDTMQAYSDPKRENDPHALPNTEVWPEDKPTTTCRDCGNDFPDEDMLPCDDGEGEWCHNCAAAHVQEGGDQ